MMDIIELTNVSHFYPGEIPALNKINLSIKKGEKVVFLGHNGSGKTTLFLLLAGVLKDFKGSYFFNGCRMKKKDLKKIYKSAGIVFQDPEIQLLASTVFSEVAFGPTNLGWDEDRITNSVERALKDTGVSHLRNRPPHLLSYGQKKCVAIADILAMGPEVIIMDEPLTWLDMEHKRRVLKMMDELNRRGKTLILSSHDPDFTYEWADRVFILKEGALLGEGTPDVLFNRRDLIDEAALELPLLYEISKRLKLEKGLRSRDELLNKLEVLWESL